MISSKDKTDKRLIDIVRVQKARRLGIKIGFDGLSLDDNENEDQILLHRPQSELLKVEKEEDSAAEILSSQK